jgi:hypothetical protein
MVLSLPVHHERLNDQFDSEALIISIGVPMMIRHSTTDGNIPNRRGKRLYTAPPEPKIKIEAEGAGRLAAWDNGAREPAPKALIAEPRRTHGVRLRKRLPSRASGRRRSAKPLPRMGRMLDMWK